MALAPYQLGGGDRTRFPQPTIPPAVSIRKTAYSRPDTGSRTVYALQVAMASEPEPGAAAPACAASKADRRALRK